MTKSLSFLLLIIPGVLVVLSGAAISAQDKYTLQVPGGLAFSEFRGYEDWQVISVSHSGDLFAVILGNPAMIKAYQAGVPGHGNPFPDGAKMAKIHWNAKKSAEAPAPTAVPDTLHDIDFMVKDSKRFADSVAGGMARSSTTRDPTRSHQPLRRMCRRRETTPSAGSHATRS